MIDTFALLCSHGLLVLVILRVIKIRDPALPPLPERKKFAPARARLRL